MEVIKLGGSLTRSDGLKACLDSVNRRSRKQSSVIVPGGGSFADQVRTMQQKWRFDDRAAHCMAILAMQQMALLLESLQPTWPLVTSVGAIANGLEYSSVVIWSPQVEELDRAGVAASWDVTSDSLAAWLAGQLKADGLLLVKLADLPEKATVEQLQAQGVIDRAFHRYSGDGGLNTQIINPQQL